MKTLLKLRLRLADATGAITEEFSFMSVVALALVGVLAAVTKSPFLAGLFTSLFQDLFQHFTNWLGGLFS